MITPGSILGNQLTTHSPNAKSVSERNWQISAIGSRRRPDAAPTSASQQSCVGAHESHPLIGASRDFGPKVVAYLFGHRVASGFKVYVGVEEIECEGCWESHTVLLQDQVVIQLYKISREAVLVNGTILA